MEIFFIGLGIIIMLIIANSIKAKIGTLDYKIDLINEKINKLQESEKLQKKAAETPTIVTSPIKNDVEEEYSKYAPPSLSKEPVHTEPASLFIQEEPIIHYNKIVSQNEASIKEPEKSFPSPKETIDKEKTREPELSFFERNPDLEKFIGENLINKIGIAILVLGIGFFVKYAIDQNWIKEIGRVFIGILCGGILIGFAHRLRNTFKAFSSVLVGGGLAVLYFIIGIAFHDYQIFNQTTAFAIMVVITAFSIVLSLAYNRIELAVLSLIGGFATPFMLSTGEGNYIVLFTYLLILDLGMLVLAYYKKWNLVNILSYIFTYLIFSGWYVTLSKGLHTPYVGALIYVSIFYFIFYLMSIIYNVKENIRFTALEIGLLLSNTIIYFSFGLNILYAINDGLYAGMFTALLAVFNMIFVFIFYKKKNIDATFLYLLIGIVLTFVSLIAPIQLKGNFITLFWAMESVLLLWLYQKSNITLLKLTSILITILMLISLIMDWGQNYYSYLQEPIVLRIIFNRAFITSVVALISLTATRALLKNEKNEIFIGLIPVVLYRNILSFIFVIMLYVSLLLELVYQLNQYVNEEEVRIVISGIYNFVFVWSLLIYIYRNSTMNEWIKGIAFVFAIPVLFSYLIYYHSSIIQTRNAYILDSAYGISGFLLHYPLLLCFIGILITEMKYLIKNYSWESVVGKISLWGIAFIIILSLSQEISHLAVMINYSNELEISDIVNMVNRTVFPVLWGLLSFIFMFFGMKKGIQPLRIISLTLFAITLLKLFIFDLRNISDAGKIISFILLGVLLLVISFMYQKLKKLILDNGEKK